jgi:hypothetical protein
MSPLSEDTVFSTASVQEKELENILIDISLYRDMYPEEKKKLINYLVLSYFNNIQKHSRALPR